MKTGAWIVLSFVMGIIGGYFLLHSTFDPVNLMATITPIPEGKNLNCDSGRLNDSAFCLKEELKTFYKPVYRNDMPKTEENLKEFGGDCYDYSWWYIRKLKAMGFKAYPYVIRGGGDMAHLIAIAYDPNNNYCILDQLVVHCVTFDADNITPQGKEK